MVRDKGTTLLLPSFFFIEVVRDKGTTSDILLVHMDYGNTGYGLFAGLYLSLHGMSLLSRTRVVDDEKHVE